MFASRPLATAQQKEKRKTNVDEIGAQIMLPICILRNSQFREPFWMDLASRIRAVLASRVREYWSFIELRVIEFGQSPI